MSATTTETKRTTADLALTFEMAGESGRIPLTFHPRFRGQSIEAGCAAVEALVALAHIRSLRADEPGRQFRLEVAQNDLARAVGAAERLHRYAEAEG